jgi:hypothetical protein
MAYGVAEAIAEIDRLRTRQRISAHLLRAMKDRQGDSENFVRYLLRTTDLTYSLLSWAACNEEGTFKLLLNMEGIDVNINDTDGHTLLSRALAEE